MSFAPGRRERPVRRARSTRALALTAVTLVTLLAAAAMTFAACSSFESVDATTDAGPEAAGGNEGAPTEDAPAMEAGVDAAQPDAAATMCDPLGQFAAPALVPVVNTVSGEQGARLTRDELTIYFSSARPGHYDLYAASRTSVATAFGAATPILMNGNAEDYPAPSPDGLELFFSRNASPYRVMVMTRTTLDAGFTNPLPVDAVNDAALSANNLGPFVAQNGDLYFISDRRTATSNDIFRTPRLDGGTFGPAEALDGLTTAVSERAPVLSFDMLTMYFDSSRADQGGDSAGDIWVARRASVGAAFADPKPVPELNRAGALDFPTWLSADNCRLYMTSLRDSSHFQIYVATRIP